MKRGEQTKRKKENKKEKRNPKRGRERPSAHPKVLFPSRRFRLYRSIAFFFLFCFVLCWLHLHLHGASFPVVLAVAYPRACASRRPKAGDRQTVVGIQAVPNQKLFVSSLRAAPKTRLCLSHSLTGPEPLDTQCAVLLWYRTVWVYHPATGNPSLSFLPFFAQPHHHKQTKQRGDDGQQEGATRLPPQGRIRAAHRRIALSCGRCRFGRPLECPASIGYTYIRTCVRSMLQRPCTARRRTAGPKKKSFSPSPLPHCLLVKKKKTRFAPLPSRAISAANIVRGAAAPSKRQVTGDRVHCRRLCAGLGKRLAPPSPWALR